MLLLSQHGWSVAAIASLGYDPSRTLGSAATTEFSVPHA
jgi:hypothetical protein